MADLEFLRGKIRDAHHREEAVLLADLVSAQPVDAAVREQASVRAVKMIEGVRGHASPGLMEVFLSEYGLSTDEGHCADVSGRGPAAGAGQGNDRRTD